MAAAMDKSSWVLVDQGESKPQLLLKTVFHETDCSYALSLFDGLTLWQELVSSDTFKIKCKEFNPKVEADPVYLLQELKQNCDGLKHGINFTLNKNDGNNESCELSVKFILQAGVPFSWKFELTKGSEEAMSDQLTFPMLSMLGELQRQQNELFKLLEKKDIEILDYREQGLSLSRKNIETARFDAKAFKDASVRSKGFSSAVEKPMSTFLDLDIKCLYENIMEMKLHKKAVEATELMETQTYGTQLLDAAATEPDSHTQLDIVKTSTESSNSSTIDKELKRRGIIEKRLAEHKHREGRSEKRSRKINL